MIDISRHIWETKYRHQDGAVIHDQTIEDTWRRVSRALASVEPKERRYWSRQFYQALQDYKFLPGGRILAGAGAGRRVTLFNCFVMGLVGDSIDGIFDALKEGALTMQQGGGVGYDFSSLRPSGARACATGSIASGPVSFMTIWDSMCATLLSTGARRGAMMATLRCDHPDIESFIEAKRDSRALRHFNLSVQISDEFMAAVAQDADWPLVFPAAQLGDGAEGETVARRWSGQSEPVVCRIIRRVRARSLWDQLVSAACDCAEPGVLFIDRINRLNNLHYRETLTATNPCGEIPLPPYGACNLGSINLTCFVQSPFSADARLDMASIRTTVIVATRMLDNVIDLSRFPLKKQAEQARGCRRIGLGVTGLADALIMLGLNYGAEQARRLAAWVMETICHTAYRTSIELAQEKGPFPFFDREPYLESEFIQRLPEDIRAGIARHGIRNSHLIAIAPTGTISLLAANISSGMEPVFDFYHKRRVLEADGGYQTYALTDYAYHRWLELKGGQLPPPDCFVTARQLPPGVHLDMQAALQPYVDNAISKTINLPEQYPLTDCRSLFDQAFAYGLKGVTVFRPNPVSEAILSSAEGGYGVESAHCCSIEREAD